MQCKEIINVKNKKIKIIENIIKKIREFYADKLRVRDYTYLCIYILFTFIILFSVAKIIRTETNFYNENLTFRWRNVLSYDDMLYARDVYTTNPKYEDVIHLSIHPLFDVMAQGVAKVNDIIFLNNDPSDHYYHIVIFQIIVNLIGIFYLYKILHEQIGLKNIWTFLLLTIYEISTVTLLGTLVVESFLVSATLLIASYYYLSKQKLVISSILGILVTGACITNSLAFGIMAIFLLKNKKDILKVGASCIIGGIIAFFLIPYKEYIINNLFSSIDIYINTYSLDYNFETYMKMIFYYIFSSPMFFLNIIHTQPNGLDYINFDLSAGIPIIIMTVIFFIVILYNIIKNIKDRNFLAALGVFIYNMFIHIVMRFGIYEASIYGLHFLFAEILMIAFGFKIKNKMTRRLFVFFSLVFLFVQLRYNINGMLKCILLFKNWK